MVRARVTLVCGPVGFRACEGRICSCWRDKSLEGAERSDVGPFPHSASAFGLLEDFFRHIPAFVLFT